MEDNFSLQQCSEEDALEFESNIYKAGSILTSIQDLFKDKVGKIVVDTLESQQIDINPGGSSDKTTIHFWNWFDRGIKCKILKLGSKGWQAGRIRLKVSLEFIPDQPEDGKPTSSLDDIRKSVNNDIK